MASTSTSTLPPGPSNTTLICYAGVEENRLPDRQMPSAFHQICIDSAATFSVIDHDYAQTHFPNIRWALEPSRQISTVSIKGDQISLGSTRLIVQFTTRRLELFQLPVTFYRIHLIHHPVLLGVPFLRDSDALVNFSVPWIHFQSVPSDFYRCDWKHGTGRPDPCVVTPELRARAQEKAEERAKERGERAEGPAEEKEEEDRGGEAEGEAEGEEKFKKESKEAEAK